MKLRLLLAAALLLPCLTFAQTKWIPYEADITFKIKNAGITVNGTFSNFKGEILFSPDKLGSSKIEGSVDAATLATGISMRDKTIKDSKYLDANSHKLIEGKSTKLYYKGNDYAGLFNITIKGVTKEIEIPFQFNQFAESADIIGSFTLNRRDFNVGGSSMTMGDEVTVRVKIKVKKA